MAPPDLYVQRDQPPGVPPLHLTGERTLPDVPEENYWYRRHLAVYEWIAQRVHGRRVVDLACGEGYGSAALGRTAASVGVDPAPHYRRLYNPVAQQRRHDPEGEYVRRWCPELRDVPLAKLAEPWTMTAAEQAAAGCTIGRDYPEPIVDHATGRARAIAAYQAARATIESG